MKALAEGQRDIARKHVTYLRSSSSFFTLTAVESLVLLKQDGSAVIQQEFLGFCRKERKNKCDSFSAIKQCVCLRFSTSNVPKDLPFRNGIVNIRERLLH